MGWNDWYSVYCGVSAQLVEQTAQAMVDNGLEAAGYDYVNIDDCWMAGSRDSAGNLVADPTRFPDGIGRWPIYVHSARAQARHLRGRRHDHVRALAGELWPRGPGRGHVRRPGASTTSSTTAATSRTATSRGERAAGAADAVHAHEQCARARPGDRSSSRCAIPDPRRRSLDVGRADRQPVADDPRHPGQLRVDAGQLRGQRRSVQQTPGRGPGTTRTSSRSATAAARRPSTAREFSLWAEMSAPLIASTNVGALSPSRSAIYENRNVIAVDQDPLGRQGVPISSAGGAVGPDQAAPGRRPRGAAVQLDQYRGHASRPAPAAAGCASAGVQPAGPVEQRRDRERRAGSVRSCRRTAWRCTGSSRSTAGAPGGLRRTRCCRSPRRRRNSTSGRSTPCARRSPTTASPRSSASS